jgi:hypothetical protein
MNLTGSLTLRPLCTGEILGTLSWETGPFSGSHDSRLFADWPSALLSVWMSGSIITRLYVVGGDPRSAVDASLTIRSERAAYAARFA